MKLSQEGFCLYPLAWLTQAAHYTFAKLALAEPVGPGLWWEADGAMAPWNTMAEKAMHICYRDIFAYPKGAALKSLKCWGEHYKH